MEIIQSNKADFTFKGKLRKTRTSVVALAFTSAPFPCVVINRVISPYLEPGFLMV